MSNNELTHYGVIGMKWGVRKNPSKQFGKSSTKLNKKKRKLVNRQEEAAKLRYKGTKLESKATSERKLKKARELIFEAAKMDLKNAKLDKKIQKYEQKMKEAFADVSYHKIKDIDMEKGKEYQYMLKNPYKNSDGTYKAGWYMDDLDKNKYYKYGNHLEGKFFKNDKRPYYERTREEQDSIDKSYETRIKSMRDKFKSATTDADKKKYANKAMALEVELQDIHEQDWRIE